MSLKKFPWKEKREEGPHGMAGNAPVKRLLLTSLEEVGNMGEEGGGGG